MLELPQIARFVETIEPNPAVRMDLNDGTVWRLQATSRLPPPPPKRARVSTLLADGAVYPASAYDDRLLELHWVLHVSDNDEAATQMQVLARELDRPGGNILQWQPPGATSPVFFRTVRLGLDAITMHLEGDHWFVQASIPAEPFAYGVAEYLKPALNANPTFDTNITSWSAAGGGMVLAASGSFASTPDHASLDVVGDIEIIFDGTLANWNPGTVQTLVSKYNPTGDQRSYALHITAAGLLRLIWSTAGTSGTATGQSSSAATGAAAGSRLAVRATLDVNNGAAGHDVRFYTAPTAAGPWVQLGTVVTGAGVTSLHAGTTNLIVGTNAGLTETVVGTIHYAEVRNGLAGPAVANPNFEAQADGVTSFTDAAGRLWTLNGAAAVERPQIAHSTTTVYRGSGSLQLTPDGVTPAPQVVSESVSVTAGGGYVVSAWVKIPTGYSSVRVAVNWFDAGSGLLSTSTGTSYAAPVGQWVYVSGAFTAPASTATARLRVELTGTPPATAVTYIDDAQLREAIALLNNPATTVNGMFIDFSDIKGDVEAPLLLREYGLEWFNGSVLLATRRRGDVTAVPFALQAEAMTQGTDTTTQPNDAGYSGSGNNFSRVSFATSGTSMVTRLSQFYWPTTPSVAARGTYRVFARVKRSSATGTISVRLSAGPDGATVPVIATAVTAETTQFRLLDFGLVSIPAGSDPVFLGPTGRQIAATGVAVELAAQRASGTSTLDVDYLLFVPADDQLCIIEIGNDSTGDGYAFDGINDVVYAWDVSGGVEGISHSNDLVVTGYLPSMRPGTTNRLYMVSNPNQQAVVTVRPELDGVYWPRYLSVRPANG